ncbi:MAG: Bax inhibitor-1/YccA family protein [Desulfobacterium sp.]|nr:Bax inhibitor-1/YccA family protein [Desulfobacterium sp.]MBU3948255.1 Bax inhibitor-1/YccA family protein [Pseudomonadota bacterium]MBU4037631.1 Bax inhibitor-1/YccA family protein [Pseudomonadota bacterium]
MQQTYPLKNTQTQIMLNEFIRSVYNWMGIGLALTGLVAYYVSNDAGLQNLIFGNKLVFFGLIIAELALVFTISARVSKMKASTATALFIIYAALNGATLSVIFLIYTASSITSTFFICSATFIACSIYGMTTKRDLTSMGGFMAMGLIGIIIASVVNIFIRSSAMNMIISYIGVIVFVGLTAYDTQKLKNMALTQPSGLDAGVVRKGAILGALSLYLDFINLFLMLLRILGDRR